MNTKERMARAAYRSLGLYGEYENSGSTKVVVNTVAEAVLTEQMEISAEVRAIGDEALMEEKPADYISRAMTQGILEGK